MERAALDRGTRAIAAMGFVLPALLACNEHPLKDVELVPVVVDDGTVEINPNKDVDILFVIDNSGSMGEEQGTLAANFAAFIEVLEDPEVDANYRIAVTTTDNGNPYCSGTTPEGGAFVMTSCQDRLEQFVFAAGTEAEKDKRVEACEEHCPPEFADIELQPTTVADGGAAEARPWLERRGGASNLPGDMDTVQGFQCFGPQGINGCGFESPLETMYKALRRTFDAEETSYGFVRDEALLAIVFVTDEADCSYQVQHQDIFLPDGDRAFWEDPNAAYPTSAVCWNAGVACEGGPGQYADCWAQDHASNGEPAASDDDAVLHPLSRYVDLLEDIEYQKRHLDPKQDILVSVIAGVPEGYPDQRIVYQDSLDPGFQGDFGIGPGCTSSAGEAVPPVRLRELAETMQADGDPNMFSICQSDYSAALHAIADRIRKNLRPGCVQTCVRDMDPTTAELDPSCVVRERLVDGTRTVVVPCEHDGSEWVPPAGADLCYRALTGDEMSEQCTEEGWNLEFKTIRAPGVQAPNNSSIEATCEVSMNKSVDCPDL
jgi:hypothetical protein